MMPTDSSGPVRGSDTAQSLELYFHPLASYCWKVLLALYENGTPFVPRTVDLSNPEERAELLKISPFAKFPVLVDRTRAEVVLESSIIVEYLEQYRPGSTKLLPREADLARRARFWDRFFDCYLEEPMQKIVGDRLRRPEERDAFGVAQAKTALVQAYAVLERELGAKQWILGEAFSLGDCAALPALYYANRVVPFGSEHRATAAYLERSLARPAGARVLAEATPYFRLFPAA